MTWEEVVSESAWSVCLFRAAVVVLSVCSLGAAVAQPQPEGAKPEGAKAEGEPAVDEFLFPLPGELDRNISLLDERVRTGAGPDVQAVYGIQLLKKGHHALARKHCEEAVARGELFEPRYCMSMIAFAEGKLAEAADHAHAALRLRPSSVAPYLVLAHVRRTVNDREGMVAAIELGLAALPGRADFWEWELARMLEQLGDLDGSLQCIGTLARITPSDPRVFTQAGDWLRRLSRLAEAAQMYRFALDKASWYRPAALGLLETLESDGLPLEVIRVAERFLRNPQLAAIHGPVREFQSRAQARLLEGELASLESRNALSLTDLHTLDELDPSFASSVLLDAAQLCLTYGRPDRAVQLLEKADSMLPSDGDVLRALGQALARIGRLDEAKARLGESLDVAPVLETLLASADVERRLGNAADCLQLAARALEIRPDSVVALLDTALCHRALRHTGEEQSSLDKAFSVNPEHMEVLEELVRFHLHRKGGMKEAARYLQLLVNLAPYDYRLCMRLGRMQQEEGDSADALATHARCLAAIPPEDLERRKEVYGHVKALVPRVRQQELAVQTLTQCCSLQVAGACDDLAAWRKTSKKRERLVEADYRPVPPRGRKGFVGELERLGPGGTKFLVLGLEAPGFDSLAKEERLFLFFMSRAAIAGDDLLYRQNHRHALAIKNLMETLFRYRTHLSGEQTAAVHDYLKLLWVNHGNYDHRSGMKFVPELLTREMLRNAMVNLVERGEELAFIPGNGVDEKLAFLDRDIFDAEYEKQLTVTEPGRDIVLESAVNHYDPGVTDAMIAALEPKLRNALNVRFTLRGGTIMPLFWKVGGLGTEHLEQVVYFLEQALEYAGSVEQKESIAKLVDFYRSGDEEAFRQHSIAWLKTKGRTDYLNGFVEQLKDPRGIIGNYEGMSAFVSDAELVEKLADRAADLERAMPWPDPYKRESVARPVANVATLLTGTGDMGPVPWAGYNLPNYDDIRTSVGSKNVVFVNLLNARSEKDFLAGVKEFYLPEYHALVKGRVDLVSRWVVYLHEILGHGSGRSDASLKDDPRNLIGQSFSTLEEARADLVALYHMGSPDLVAIGVFPADRTQEVLLATYVTYFQGFLMLYRRFEGEIIREPHWKGRQLILSYLLAGGEEGGNDFGLVMEQKEGKYFVRVTDPLKVRAGIARLLERVQTIKSTADRDGAEKLIERFGTRFDPAVRDDISRRSAVLKLTHQTAFVFPHVIPVRGRGGEVIDARVVNDEDLTAQHLRWSRLQQGRELD